MSAKVGGAGLASTISATRARTSGSSRSVMELPPESLVGPGQLTPDGPVAHPEGGGDGRPVHVVPVGEEDHRPLLGAQAPDGGEDLRPRLGWWRGGADEAHRRRHGAVGPAVV